MGLDLANTIEGATGLFEHILQNRLAEHERVHAQQIASAKYAAEQIEKYDKLLKNRLQYAARGARRLLAACKEPKMSRFLNVFVETTRESLLVMGSRDEGVLVELAPWGLYVSYTHGLYHENYSDLYEIAYTKGGDQYSQSYPIIQELRILTGKHLKGTSEESVKAVDAVDLSESIAPGKEVVTLLQFFIACNREKQLLFMLAKAIEKIAETK